MTGNVGWVHFVALVGEDVEERLFILMAGVRLLRMEFGDRGHFGIVFSSPPYSMAQHMEVPDKDF